MYHEHGRQAAALLQTLRALKVDELEIRSLGASDWPRAADRVVQERVRQGRSVHGWKQRIEVIDACNDGGDAGLCEWRLAHALCTLGVETLAVLLLVAREDSIHLLADRLALELEKQGHPASYVAVRQVLRRSEHIILEPCHVCFCLPAASVSASFFSWLS